jgi:DNA-binding NarL/FixJ family response regulator
MASTPSRQTAQILLVDDHPIVRLGVRELISTDPTLAVRWEADSAESALALVKSTDPAPDLAIVDLSLGEVTGLDLLQELHKIAPGLPMLVLSVHDGQLFAERALRAGARGYITKREAISGLLPAIHEVLAGQQHVTRGLAPADGPAGTDRPAEPLTALTNRELEVFEMIGRGMSTAAIARSLALSVKTVETYRSNIKTKLHLNSGTDLVRYAAIWAERI